MNLELEFCRAEPGSLRVGIRVVTLFRSDVHGVSAGGGVKGGVKGGVRGGTAHDEDEWEDFLQRSLPLRSLFLRPALPPPRT